MPLIESLGIILIIKGNEAMLSTIVDLQKKF